MVRHKMTLRNSCLLLFAVIVLVQGGQSMPLENTLQVEFQKVKHVVDVGRVLQGLIPSMRRAIIYQGMDPLELNDFSECILPLPGILKGNINFRDGWLQQLSTIRYVRNAIMTYSDKRLVLDFTLVWDYLDFNYEYDFRYLVLTRNGDIDGHLENAEIRVVITLDLLTYTINLEQLKFVNVGKLTIKLEGHLLDPLFNVGARLVTTLFKDHSTRMIEERTVRLLRSTIKEINDHFPKPKQILDLTYGNAYTEYNVI